MRHDRMARVNRLLQTTLADMVPGLIKDPRVREPVMVSLMEVRTTPDLRHARVYVSIRGGGEHREQAAFEALQQASGFLRAELGRRARLRHTPELEFARDTTLDNAAHIEGILRELSVGGEDQD